MPTYTYRCQKCGEEFERFQSMSDEPVKRCPACKGKVQRTFHPVGIVLKGSGFHKTDYRSPSKKSGDRSTSQGEDSSGSSGSKGEGDQKGSGGKPSSETSKSKSGSSSSSSSSSKD